MRARTHPNSFLTWLIPVALQISAQMPLPRPGSLTPSNHIKPPHWPNTAQFSLSTSQSMTECSFVWSFDRYLLPTPRRRLQRQSLHLFCAWNSGRQTGGAPSLSDGCINEGTNEPQGYTGTGESRCMWRAGGGMRRTLQLDPGCSGETQAVESCPRGTDGQSDSLHPHACPLTLEGSTQWGEGLGKTNRQSLAQLPQPPAAELEEATTPPSLSPPLHQAS